MKNKELLDLIANAKKCVSCEKPNRQTIKFFLDKIEKLISRVFDCSYEILDEDEFIEKLTYLQYITFALALVTEKHRLSLEETVRLFHSVFTSLCGYKDEELARNFNEIISVVLTAATKLEQGDYENVLMNILDVIKYCEPGTSCSTVLPKFIAPKTGARIETDSDGFFKLHLSQNIIVSMFGKMCDKYVYSDVFLLFWPHCLLYLKENSAENTWILENCLNAGLKIMRMKKQRDSVIEQTQFISELFSVFGVLIKFKSSLHGALSDLFKEIQNFIKEHEKVTILHKESRESMLEWMTIYIEIIEETNDEFGLLESFSSWLVDLTAHQEVHDFPTRICMAPSEICVQRIRSAIQTLNIDCLHNYLDIVASLFKLTRIQKADSFQWFIMEIQSHNSLDNPRWPHLLGSLLSVQHPVCQQFCKKFAPSFESLWLKLKNGESSRNAINSLAIVLGSCSFLNNNDEGVKQILPFLLLPCFRDFRERAGTKWDNFRIIGGQRVGVSELIDLERFTSVLESNNSESSKLRAVHCALQIEKKTGKYINLVSDMSLAVLSKSQTEQIVHCLPALVHFLSENQQFINDFVSIIITKLCEKHSIYSEETFLEMCKTIQKLVCIASNGRNSCKKCEQKGFVEPDTKGNIKIDERSLTLFVKGVIENRKKHPQYIIREFLQTCRVILLHIESRKLISAFTPIVKAVDIGHSENSDYYFLLWELISWKSEASYEKKLLIYVPLFARAFSTLGSDAINKLNNFAKNVLKTKLSDDVKVIFLAALFSHSVITNKEFGWNITTNWCRQFASNVLDKVANPTEEEQLQVIIKRYAPIFTRSFLFRLFYDGAILEAQKISFDELKVRETARSFVSQVQIHFKFPNMTSAIIALRSSLFYGSLIFGSRGSNPKHVCSIIDFICQELSTSNRSASVIPTNPTDMSVVFSQRKALITEIFPQLVQFWTFESCKKSETIWKFCADYCNFKEEDIRMVTSTYRKEVFEHLLLVSPQELCDVQERSLIVGQLRKTYENMKKGEKFMISTAMDTRNEGIEFIFSFRAYFTNDAHFLIKDSAAASFRIVLQNLKPEFFDTNWYTILMTLRQSPPTLEATSRSWIAFIDQLNYPTLRMHIWRILTDLSRVSNNEEIIERLWNRLSYANEIDKISIDDMFKQVFWIIPLEVEKKIDLNLTIAKSRRTEDVFEFIRQFARYPSLQFIDNLKSKIDRGTIWKDDLPKLMGALSGILPSCQSANQRSQLLSIIQKVPITNSELADHDFIRWDTTFKFFSEPRQLTQAVLEECAEIVENMSGSAKIEYADRTMCEVYKFFNYNGLSQEMKSSLDGIKNFYAKIICSKKPEPPMMEQRTIDELSNSVTRKEPFARWLTVLILKCAEMAEDAPLASLISIAHIDDSRFLAKLAMRFILTVIHMERDSVTQWILNTFEETLTNAHHRRLTNSDRGPATFIFYVFDFIYFYSNLEEVRRKKKIREKVIAFWRNMMAWTVKDEHEHDQPLIVKVAESFGMEKRCILWLELFMEQKKRESGDTESETEAAYYFTLMNLYARIHELNGVRGSYARLSKLQMDHVYGKICIREAFGDYNSATSFAEMTGKGNPFNATEAIKKLIEEQNTLEYCPSEKREQDEYVKSLKTLSQWVKTENDIGPSPYVFSRNIEFRSIESSILTMIQNDERDEIIDEAIQNAKSKIVDRLSECALGGSCSYETTTPFIVELQKLDEIVELKNASKDDLVGFDSEFWKNLHKRTNDGEQTMGILEPILRVRRSMLDIRMNLMGERDRDNIRSRIVETHLQSARIARLTGCLERAQLSLINAKKVLPFENKIVLEEAKLQLQTSDELSGMSLLDSIISKNFGDLQNIYGDTQQSVNLDVQKLAKHKIETYPVETKNLFSSVQMLRISHMIKAGNTIGFEKIYNETTQLLQCFAHSGVMYEAAWLLDYLFHYNERTKHVLPLLKAYREVAKYETNQVLQARAVERMTSLWLSNTRKINNHIASNKLPEGQISDLKQNIKSMNREIQSALDHIGWRAFYPAYAVLARHIDHQDDEVARTIKHIMKQLILRMPHQCMWQSVYLLRQNIAHIKEKYMDVLSEVKRKSPCYVTLIDQYDYASGIFNMVSGKVDSNDCKLSEKVEGLKLLFRDKKYDPKELVMNRRLEGDCKILSGIMVPIRSVIDESVHDPAISDDGFEESCHLPDRYLIHDFSEKVKVLHSNTKPVIIDLTTMAGRKVRLICKKDDDLTKDYHFTKMVEMCNDLLMKDEQTKIQKMAATTYSVIPLAKQGGIIEFIEGVTPFYDTLDKLMGMKPNEWMESVKSWNDQMKTKSKEDRAKYFREVCCKKTPVVMARWFRLQYPEAGKWFASRKLFAKSTAVMSIIGYIFGLGDRHTKNLMVHLPTGKCIHVDFDMIFNKGETLGTPELVPFRLTQNMINGMGEVALDGEFRTVCEQALRVFRENSFEIEKYIADLPNLVADFANNKLSPKDFDMKEAKRLVSGRLRGQIVTAKLYRGNPISHPMQVSQLASSLIDLATSDEKLCEMFLGWMATL